MGRIERWINKTFFGWLGSNNALFGDFKIVLESDSYPEKFIEWLIARPAMEICEQRLSEDTAN